MNTYRRHATVRESISTGTIFASLLLLTSLCTDLEMTLVTKVHADTLEEVVVTARRKEENLQDVPITITALSNDYLRKANITQLSDIRTHVPSLGISVGGSSSNTPIISLRGQRPSEVLTSLDPAVPLYFNDVALSPTQGTNLSLYDLENIQVLKGPQGTLFGRNSTGGAVLFSPMKPGDELGGYFDVQAGNYSLLSFEGAVDVPVNDMLKLRLAIRKVDRNGYQDNLADNELRADESFWDEHSEAIRVSAMFEPNERLQSLTVFDWNRNEMSARVPTPAAFKSVNFGNADLLIPFCNLCGTLSFAQFADPGVIDDALERQRNRSVHEIETDYDAREYVRNIFASNTTTFEINDNFTVKNIFGYRNLEFSNQFDTDGTALALLGNVTTGIWNNPATNSIVTGSNDFPPRALEAEQFSNEFQVIFNNDANNLEIISGLYYFELSGTDKSPVQVTTAVLQDSPAGDTFNRSSAVFAEATYDPADYFSFTAGVRYTWDYREVTVRNLEYAAGDLEGIRNGENFQCRTEEPGSGIAGFDANGDPIFQAGVILDPATTDCRRRESKDFRAPTWRVVGQFKPLDGVMFYNSLSTGYRSGGFNLRGQRDADLQPFNEETVLTWELGTKIDWTFDNGVAMRLNAAFFKQNYEEIQKSTTVPGAGVSTAIINAAEAIITGADIEFGLEPIEGLSFNLNYGLVETSYRDWVVPNPVGPGTVDASDRPFTWIPKHSITSSLSYQLPIPEEFGEVSLRASLYWQSEMKLFDLHGPWQDIPFLSDDATALLNTTLREDSYTVIDYRIDWRNIFNSGADLAAWVKNANDTEYRTGGLNIINVVGWASYVYGPPKTYGLSLRYNF